jgi:hypothetical protein
MLCDVEEVSHASLINRVPFHRVELGGIGTQ